MREIFRNGFYSLDQRVSSLFHFTVVIENGWVKETFSNLPKAAVEEIEILDFDNDRKEATARWSAIRKANGMPVPETPLGRS